MTVPAEAVTVPCVEVPLTNDSPGGSVDVSVTPAAVDGPLFVTEKL